MRTAGRGAVLDRDAAVAVSRDKWPDPRLGKKHLREQVDVDRRNGRSYRRCRS